MSSPLAKGTRPPSPLLEARRALTGMSRRPTRILALALAAFLALILWLHHQQTFLATPAYIPFLTNKPAARPEEHAEATAAPAAPHISAFSPPDSNMVYRLFTPRPAAQADTAIRANPAHEAISEGCLEAWIAHGRWRTPECARLVTAEVEQQERIDIVWTWVNGSDPLHAAARAPFAPAPNPKVPAAVQNQASARQFREHDELRFSMRAAAAATRAWRGSSWHIVTNSYAVPDGGVAEGRLGQVPQWLDIAKAEDGRVQFHHDTDIFRPVPIPPAAQVSSEDLATWRAQSLPTFDSMAVESQLANLPDSVSPNTVFMMDDIFLLRALPPTAFYAPWGAPVLRTQPDLAVSAPAPGAKLQPGAGEWRGLQTAAGWLGARFGARQRPYVAHFARSLPLWALHEAQLAFPEAWRRTAWARVRGLDEAEPEAHTLWLATQYVVERHREALLWSWAVAKWGTGAGEGTLSAGDKVGMWRELGGAEGEEVMELGLPYRTSKARAKKEVVPDPEEGSTSYVHLSADGYPYGWLHMMKRPLKKRPAADGGWPDVGKTMEEVGGERRAGACKLERKCLGEGEEGAWALFRRVLAERPECGDCVITALLHKSGPEGLSAFLPPPASRVVAGAPHDGPAHLPLTLDPEAQLAVPANARAFALRLLQRYSYVLGSTAAQFVGLKDERDAEKRLQAVDGNAGLGMVCVNDEIGAEAKVAGAERALWRWGAKRWPERMEVEKET